MAGEYLLGIDIGTSESKGVIVDVDGIVVAQAAVAHDLSMPRPGWAEHDADKVWWSDFCHLCGALLTQGGLRGTDIAAVGCSTIAPCMLPVDAAGRPLRPALLYGIDTRAVRQIAALEEELGAAHILQTGGNALSTQSVGPKIRWLHDEEPDVYRRAHKFLTGTSYLVFKLTGECVVDLYTGCSFGPMFDIHNLRWDAAMCDAIVEPGRLPELRWTTDVVGVVSQTAAAETGLAVGTPVIAGTADAAAEAVSVGVVAPGQMMLMYGSTLFFIEVTERLAIDERLWPSIYLFPGTYALAAGMATSGSITRWFRDQFAQCELAEEKKGERSAYAVLADESGTIAEGSDGLLVLPYFAGERTPLNDPWARGVFAGLTLAHTRAHVYRAILEGTAYGVRHHLGIMDELGRRPRSIVAVGGGTRNRLWLQIVSDVSEAEQHIPAQTIGAAYGDAFLAGRGIGLFGNHCAIDRWVKVKDRVVPRPLASARYRKYYALYRALYESSKGPIHELARLAGEN